MHILAKKPPLETKTKTPAAHTTRKTQNSLFDETATSSPATKASAKKTALSRVQVRYDVGFSKPHTIRGKGANLSWSKGIPLKNNGPDEWVWETDALLKP